MCWVCLGLWGTGGVVGAVAAEGRVEEEVVEGDIVEKKASSMDKILDASANPPSIDDVVEGKVIGIEKSAVYIDIPPFGTGIIFGREYINARDIIKKINVGDAVAGKVRIQLTSSESGGIAPGRYLYDIEITQTSSGIKTRVIEGIVTITPQITQI